MLEVYESGARKGLKSLLEPNLKLNKENSPERAKKEIHYHLKYMIHVDLAEFTKVKCEFSIFFDNNFENCQMKSAIFIFLL